jgi:glycosyltransferase A (GT-A) superfamily protein (DUF2064 family)
LARYPVLLGNAGALGYFVLKLKRFNHGEQNGKNDIPSVSY